MYAARLATVSCVRLRSNTAKKQHTYIKRSARVASLHRAKEYQLLNRVTKILSLPCMRGLHSAHCYAATLLGIDISYSGHITTTASLHAGPPVLHGYTNHGNMPSLWCGANFTLTGGWDWLLLCSTHSQ